MTVIGGLRPCTTCGQYSAECRCVPVGPMFARPASSNGIPQTVTVPNQPGMNDRTTLAAVNHLRKLVRFHYPNASDAAINATARLLAVRVADYLDRLNR